MANADVLRLQTNVPETIALEFVDGLPVSSKFGGDQIMFSLCDGRKMFLAPAVARKIAEAGVRPQQPFRLCKREMAQGNRRIVDYVVAPLNETGSVAPSPASASKETPAKTPSSAPSSYANGLHVVAPPAAAVVVPAAPTPTPSAVPGFAVDSQTMNGCYTTAVDVALAAVTYAKERGLLLSPEFGDVRQIAATLYIAQSKGGR